MPPVLSGSLEMKTSPSRTSSPIRAIAPSIGMPIIIRTP